MVPSAGAATEWLPSSERLVFRGESVLIGQVRCPPTATHFRNCGEARRPTQHAPTVANILKNCFHKLAHSYRNATMGSTFIALRVGM